MPNFTKMAIRQTFIRLLNEKPLNQITVKDIVETCGINRNSFYYHFADIPALIEEIIQEDADRIITEYPSIDSLEMCLNAALDFAEENRRAILHIYHSVNRAVYEKHLWQVCRYVITTYGKTVFADQEIDERDKNLIVRYYQCLCFGMMMEWTNGGMKEDIREDMLRLCQLKKGGIEQMIARSREG